MDNEVLVKKINKLQAEMLDFNKKISPVKNNREIVEESAASSTEESTLHSICFHITLNSFKVLVCLLGPTIFPTVVYYMEGNSDLFRQMSAISCFIILLIAYMIFSVLCSYVKKIQAGICDIIHALSAMLKKSSEKFICDKTSSYDKGEMFFKIVMSTLLLSIVIFLGLLAYKKDAFMFFYASLTSSGFLLAVLGMQIHEHWKNPEKLPFYSPYKINVQFATPTPPTTVKRELNFSRTEKQRPHLSTSNPPSPSKPPSHRRLDFSGMQNAYSNNLQLPVAPPPTYQEAVSTTDNYKLPSSFSYFFRTQ